MADELYTDLGVPLVGPDTIGEPKVTDYGQADLRPFAMGAIAAQDRYRPFVPSAAGGRDAWKAADIARLRSDVNPSLAYGTGSPFEMAENTRGDFMSDLVLFDPTSPVDVGLAALTTPAGRAAIRGAGKGALAIGGLFASGSDAEAGVGNVIKKGTKKISGLADTSTYKVPGIGHNNPPTEMAMTAEQLKQLKKDARDAALAEQRAKVDAFAKEQEGQLFQDQAAQQQAWLAGLPKPKPAARGTDVPDIRGLPVADAVAIARQQPHLVRSGNQAESYYIGGANPIQSKADLNRHRREFDAYITADPRGGDWYDRYRPAVAHVTGGNKQQQDWMSAQHGQWSAGVSPESELAYVLKENNAEIAGMPTTAYYGDQTAAQQAAIAARSLTDPSGKSYYRHGDKTAEYARLINPDQPVKGATGVNDFRYASAHKYPTQREGSEYGLTAQQHRFMDHETALAVDRANKMNLGGRSNWTGEQLQAAPWVRQKALDLMARNPELSYDDAIARANTTIADYFDKHTYYAPHEAQPGYDTAGHLSRSGDATPQVKQDYFNENASTWATAPGERDAIYSGLGIPGTGVNMRVRDTLPIQGMYRRPDGTLETNPGAMARPLGGFDVGKKPEKDFIGPSIPEPFKRTPEHMRALLDAGETLRAVGDAQNAGSWHKLWFGGPAKESNTLHYPQAGKAKLGDLFKAEAAGTPFGLPDVVDSSRGITSTRFWPPPEGGKDFDKALRSGQFGALGLGEPVRARLDSNLLDLVDEWKQGHGSQAVTQKLLAAVNKTPQMREAFNSNPYIGERFRAKADRDDNWATRWGIPREDLQNLRRIIGDGPGWIDRVEDAIRKGTVALPALAGLYVLAAEGEGRAEQ